jgi:hypothetical protein
MSFLSRLLNRSCPHHFSWPRTDNDGRYYQICSRCGVAYEYDWASMHRTDRKIAQNATYSPRPRVIPEPEVIVVRLPLGG